MGFWSHRNRGRRRRLARLAQAVQETEQLDREPDKGIVFVKAVAMTA